MKALEQVWALRWISDPYLVDTAHPIRTWLEQNLNEQAVIGMRAVAVAALKHGLLQLTGGLVGPVPGGRARPGGHRVPSPRRLHRPGPDPHPRTTPPTP
jgi:hypothetical protein